MYAIRSYYDCRVMCLALNHWFKKVSGPVLPSGGQLDHDLHTDKSVDPHSLIR